ncbi:peroxide stress protein YaaA [Allonocardiopsis opalescens]|uniref:Peroxide stress protein YaaA n=1 Tax=Allonocardiopsis opalescens TaxID=1144618 RepID=A0A2T0Q0N7_9ACTN|nr:peroxide stress protein YaaA [Allonocardiopsis opalescens]PRX97350.1 hypothetical protein CLV72_106387 [Allonocardiopsis opalescens]
MLILLPPSESKAEGGGGAPADPAALGLPELAEARARVAAALGELCSGDAEAARAALGLSVGQAAELPRNTRLRTAAALPAAELYTGVLYDALRLPALLAGPHAGTVRDSVLIASALWGALRPADRVPPYRLSMAASLPPLGPLAAFWRPLLAGPLTALAEGRLVVDARSGTYAAAWRPRGRTAEHTVGLRVLREDAAGGRTVVSHMAKATRGEVAHALLAAGARPQTPKELAVAVEDLGHRAELRAPTGPGRPWVLDIVLSG